MIAPRVSSVTQRLSTVGTMTIEWEECHHSGEWSPENGGVFSHIIQATSRTFEPILPCSNSGCQGGGFEILEVVESMISHRLKEMTGMLVCIGWEHTKARLSEPSPCTRAISYRIGLTSHKKAGMPHDAKG